MPYNNISELPAQVRDNLPKRAQEIYQSAFNSAWEQYDEPSERQGNSTREETAHKVAWAAVKNKYEKKNGRWALKSD